MECSIFSKFKYSKGFIRLCNFFVKKSVLLKFFMIGSIYLQKQLPKPCLFETFSNHYSNNRDLYPFSTATDRVWGLHLMICGFRFHWVQYWYGKLVILRDQFKHSSLCDQKFNMWLLQHWRLQWEANRRIKSIKIIIFSGIMHKILPQIWTIHSIPPRNFI